MGRRKLSRDPFEVLAGPLDKNADAIAEHEDRPLAVRGALPGERVNARYLLGRRMKGRAETVDVLTAAPDRVPAPCPYFGTCSACSLQHMAPEAQLRFKQNLLSETLAAAGVNPERWLPPLSADRWHYRRKARLSVRSVKGKGRVLVGFREHDGRFVTDMHGCHTLFPPVADALPALSELLGTLDAAERIPQLEVSCGDQRVALVLRHLDPLSDADLSRLEAFETQSGFRLYLQPKGPDTVRPLVRNSPTPAGDTAPGLSYELPEEGLTFRFEPLDFVQVNAELNRAMIAQAMELLAPVKTDRALDLFCGLGNFTLPLARRCARVTGLEASPKLLERAADNARANQLDTVDYQAVDLYGEALGERWPEGAFDLVLLDPPRSGAEPVLSRIAATGARRVLYVSCNPATLATDARQLVESHGYRLMAAGAMDMFPQTTHTEAMALFERKGT